MTAEERLGSVRATLELNMETYYHGLTNYRISGENEANVKLLLKETFDIWRKCLDPKNVIDNQELEKWSMLVEPVLID